MSNLDNVDDLHSSYKLFNSLPCLHDANAVFQIYREEVFSKLRLDNTFRNYPHYAVSLSHRHATLYPGEIMASRGNITEPQNIDDLRSSNANVCAVSWLASGDPYEYATDVEASAPPPELLNAFAKITSVIPKISGIDVLGICHLPELLDPDQVWMERTAGRTSYTDRINKSDIPNSANVTTSWIVSDEGEIEENCRCEAVHYKICDSCPPEPEKPDLEKPTYPPITKN